jgi:hypothetical protein
MPLINVSIMNASSVLADSDIQPVVDALQKQVDDDFGPAWSVDARLKFVPQGDSPPAGSWWLSPDLLGD